MSRVDEHPHPVREHALSVDHEGNIWLSGGGHLVLKFSPDGEFLLQLGELGMTGGSNHTEYLGNPASVDFDPRTNEVYVADGYLNKRVIVFDMYSGEYKRHWGRYGETPDDSFEPGSIPAWSGEYAAPTGFFPRFGHGVNVANDGLVYVADRAHTLLHVYEPDGTFIAEAPTPGPINSVAFSHDAGQEFVYGAGLQRGGQDLHHAARRPGGRGRVREHRAALFRRRLAGKPVHPAGCSCPVKFLLQELGLVLTRRMLV